MNKVIETEVDILGTKYSLKIVADNEFPKDNDGNDGGVTKYYDKEIIINGSSKDECYKDFERIVRHEIIHAFLFECGLSEYTHDEFLVDFLAGCPSLFSFI